MTDEAVHLSITVRVAKCEKVFEETIDIANMEESLQRVSIAVGQESMAMSVKEIDNRISKQVPKGWRNAGTEERWLVSSLGAMRYKRRIYLDEKGNAESQWMNYWGSGVMIAQVGEFRKWGPHWPVWGLTDWQQAS